MDRITERSSQDWLQENWGSIHCLSMSMAEFTFSAARTIKTFGDGSGAWLAFAWEAATTIGSALDCLPPPLEEVEAWVGVTTPQCQCAELPGQLVLQYLDEYGELKRPAGSEQGQAKQINRYTYVEGVTTCWYDNAEGAERTSTFTVGEVSDLRWYIVPPAGTGCCQGELPPIPRIGTPVPHVVDIPTVNDKYVTTFELLDSCIDKFGILRNYYMVRFLENGSTIFKYWYWESMDGPIIYSDGWDVTFEGFNSSPGYGPPHRDEVVQYVNAGGGGCNPGLSAVNYAVSAGCTWNEDEEKYDTVYDAPVNETDNGILGLAWRLDAIAYLLEKVNLIPYDVCAVKKPKIEGRWVTAQWISDEPSPGSRLPLRKLTRWRTKSSRTDHELAEFFRDFTWDAGPACVKHVGAWWGSPQVWAASVDEGKRVIREIAREAGLDPDLEGEWEDAVSRNPRFGMTGKMRLRKLEGFPWISSRDGSNMLPMG